MRIKLVIGFCLVCVTSMVNAANLDELKGKLNKLSNEGGVYTFVQRNDDVHGAVTQSIGSLSFLHPDRFRVTYERPQQVEIISNGTNFWVYDVALNQVIVSETSEVPGARGFLSVLALGSDADGLSKSIRTDSGDGLDWLILVPESTERYQFVECAIAFDEDGNIETVRFIDLLGNEIKADFTAKLDYNLVQQDFEFEIPSGAEVIQE